MILSLAALLLATAGANAQTPEKPDAAKVPQTTTVDAWRDAMPANEAAPTVMASLDEGKTKVKGEEETTAQIEKRVLSLESKLMEAVKLRDAAALNRLLADDFVAAGVNLTGTQPDKMRFIDYALKNLELKSYNLEKTTVRAYPTTAIVTFNYKRTASVAGAAADGDFVVTDVWVKNGNKWQAVSHHISQTAKQ